jgi:ribonucleotide reductase beta subunit family protein with ferritin-like domain
MSKILKQSEVYKPFKFPWAEAIRQKHEDAHWTLKGVKNLNDDATDFKNKMSDGQKNFVVNTLKMFTQSDVQVGKVYIEYLIPMVKNNEVRCMYSSFVAREALHQEAYAALNDTLSLPSSIYSEFLTVPELNHKYEMLSIKKDPELDNLTNLKQIAAKMVFLEGVSLFGSFVMLMNFRRAEAGGIMSGMCSIVDWSVKDETIHVQGHLALLDEIGRPDAHMIKKFAKQVVEAEDAFIDYAFANYEIPGITKDEVKQYIRYITDRRCIQLGIKGIYGIKENPIPWTDEVFTANKFGNFFERTITEYGKHSLTGDWLKDSDYLKFLKVPSDLTTEEFLSGVQSRLRGPIDK